jgi:hypothetical protein
VTPVVVAIVAAIVGLVTYWAQEALKRRSALNQRREVLYENLLRDLFELLVAETGQARSNVITRIEKSWLFASDDVLAACYRFLDAYDELYRDAEDSAGVLTSVRSDPQVRDRLSEIFAGIFLAMRRDTRRSKVTPEWVEEKVRIYSWGIISRSETNSN